MSKARPETTMSMTTSTTTLLMVSNILIWTAGILYILLIGSLMRIYLQDYVNVHSVQYVCIMFVAAAILSCYTVRSHPTLLYLHEKFLAVLCLFSAVASIYVAYHPSLNEGFDQGLNENMAAYGQDNSCSHIDTVQSTLYCCGNRDYADWLNLDPLKNVPLSCCKVLQNKRDTSEEIYFTEECYNRLLDLINDNRDLVLSIGITFFILVSIFCIVSDAKRAEYEQIA